MTSFLIALQFLTRIPVKLRNTPSEKQIAQSLTYYPVVGLLIGALLYGLNLLLMDNIYDLLRAALILLTWILLTGALHLDGLADTVDALAGAHKDSNKALSIMKDPNCGPMGVISLIIIIFLKFAIIVDLDMQSSVLLIVSPLLARATVIISFIHLPYLRENGLGSSIARYFTRKANFTIILASLLFSALVTGSHSFAIIFSVVIVYIVLTKIFNRSIGGITGDTLGAQVEIVEATVLIFGVVAITMI